MHLSPYLTFNGTCEEAFKFYERHLGGKIAMMQTFGDSPGAAQMPGGMSKKIIHARIAIGDLTVMGSDASPDRFEAPKGISLDRESVVEGKSVDLGGGRIIKKRQQQQ